MTIKTISGSWRGERRIENHCKHVKGEGERFELHYAVARYGLAVGFFEHGNKSSVPQKREIS
jgi:hypothetical protein